VILKKENEMKTNYNRFDEAINKVQEEVDRIEAKLSEMSLNFFKNRIIAKFQKVVEMLQTDFTALQAMDIFLRLEYLEQCAMQDGYYRDFDSKVFANFRKDIYNEFENQI
jgi:hypothetical protein